MDWGCAATYRDDVRYAHVPHAPRLSGMAGTPAYLAPEMARGDSKWLDHRTDVYLLGGCLYEVLCGSPPHRGSAVSEVLERVRSSLVDSPVTVAAKRHPERRVPPELATIALRALQAEQDNRYADADALVAAVREWRTHQEARALLGSARRLMAEAETSDDPDTLFRRAASACEQAAELWPDGPEAPPLLITIALSHARHAAKLNRTAPLWPRQCLAERTAKKAINDSSNAETAAAIAAKAERNVANQGHRRQQLQRLRFALVATTVLVVIGLGVGLALIANQKSQISGACAKLNKREQPKPMPVPLPNAHSVRSPKVLSQNAQHAAWLNKPGVPLRPRPPKPNANVSAPNRCWPPPPRPMLLG